MRVTTTQIGFVNRTFTHLKEVNIKKFVTENHINEMNDEINSNSFSPFLTPLQLVITNFSFFFWGKDNKTLDAMKLR